MKKRFALCLSLAMLLTLSVACSAPAATTKQSPATSPATVSSATPTSSPASSPVASKTPAPTPLTDKKAVLLTFEGAKKTSMTLGDFQGLQQMTQKLTYTNSKGTTVTGTYAGIHFNTLKKFLGIDKYSALEITASDGFKSTLTPDMLEDPTSLFALQKDGQQIASSGNGYVWFCASEKFTANNWCKYIVKITVKP